MESRHQASGVLRHHAGSHDAAHLRRRDQVGPRRHAAPALDPGTPRLVRVAGRRTASTSCSARRRARGRRCGSPTSTPARRSGSRRPRSTTSPAGVRGRRGARRRVCLLFPDGRGAEPKTPEAPAGPIVQESYGRAVPARTNTYLLKDRHDEALFDHYMTSQLAAVALDGRDHAARQARDPRAAVGVAGRQVPARSHHASSRTRIRSGMGNFPVKTEVWTPDGTRRASRVRPSVDRRRSPACATPRRPGIRSITWRADEPATLVLVQALDDGDPRKDGAEARSRLAC